MAPARAAAKFETVSLKPSPYQAAAVYQTFATTCKRTGVVVYFLGTLATFAYIAYMYNMCIWPGSYIPLANGLKLMQRTHNASRPRAPPPRVMNGDAFFSLFLRFPCAVFFGWSANDVGGDVGCRRFLSGAVERHPRVEGVGVQWTVGRARPICWLNLIKFFFCLLLSTPHVRSCAHTHTQSTANLIVYIRGASLHSTTHKPPA